MMLNAADSSLLKASIQKSLGAIPGLESVNSVLLEKCTALCSKFKLSADDLSGEVEAFLMNHTNIVTISLDNLGRLEDQIQKTIQRKSNLANKAGEQVNKKRAVLVDSVKPKALAPVVDISSFSNKTVISSLASDMEPLTSRFRYMSTTLHDRARSLDKRLVKLQNEMCEAFDISEVHPVGVPSQDKVWVCGRVCCESPEGKLNNASVVLEGSSDDSHGCRVHLDLSSLSSYSLFPGQIIMVEGVNSSGNNMIAQRIIEGIPRAKPSSAPEKLLDFHHSSLYQDGKPLRVLVAAGPFTTSQNLDYEPFNGLLSKVYNERPDVLILIGPFVDASHPLMKDGDISLTDFDDDNNAKGHHCASYEMVFIERVIRDGISALFSSENENYIINTHIILVPSLADAHHEFVFPQPPFADRDLDKIDNPFFEEDIGQLDVPYSKEGDPLKRVHLMPNPCMFRINEVLFGTTSLDTILALSGEEISQSSGNRIERLAAHLLEQQSFAPIFPAPSNCVAQFDQSKCKFWSMKTSPDVLILPSKLTLQPKDINGTFVLNPGTLAKGSTKGSFAEIIINPLKEDDIKLKVDTVSLMPHNVAERIRVEILKA